MKRIIAYQVNTYDKSSDHIYKVEMIKGAKILEVSQQSGKWADRYYFDITVLVDREVEKSQEEEVRRFIATEEWVKLETTNYLGSVEVADSWDGNEKRKLFIFEI